VDYKKYRFFSSQNMLSTIVVGELSSQTWILCSWLRM